MYNIMRSKAKQRDFRRGCIFLLFILIAYATVGSYENYLDRKLENLVDPKVVLVECKDGSSHYETLDGADFQCDWRKLIF